MRYRNLEISISPAYAAKICLIQKVVSDPTTYVRVIEGLIDTGYANALKSLYESGEISLSVYKEGLRQLPGYLKDFLES